MTAQPFEVRMAHLEGAYEQVRDRLTSIDHRLGGFEQRIEGRFSSLEATLTAAMRWGSGLIFSAWVTIILAIFFHR